MGNRSHGTYAKLYRDVWTHEKTFRLASSLEALGVPEQCSLYAAVGQLHQLLCWCIAESDIGAVGHLPPREFARIVGWQYGGKTHAALVCAWRESGFLDEVATGDWRVHDLQEAASELFRKRDQKRNPDGTRPPRGRPPGVKRAESCRNPDGMIPPSRARSVAVAKEYTHPTLSPSDAAPDPERSGVCVASPDPIPPQPDPEPDDTSPCGDPALHRAWNAARSRLKPPRQPQPLTEEHAHAYAALRHATAEDAPLAIAVIDAYHADDDEFLARAGWTIKAFGYRIDGLLGDAAKRVARRAASARPKPPPEPAEPAMTAEEVEAAMAKLRSGMLRDAADPPPGPEEIERRRLLALNALAPEKATNQGDPT